MLENEEILENFRMNITRFKKLKFKEVKELYSEYINETKKRKKIQLRKNIIEGMLHYVYLYLKNNKIYLLRSSLYNMDDIINSTILYLIDFIDSDGLKVYSSYKQIFSYFYYTFLANCLIGQKYEISSNAIFMFDNFKEQLVKILEFINKNGEMSFNNFCELNNIDLNQIPGNNELCNLIHSYYLFNYVINLDNINLENNISLLQFILIINQKEYYLNCKFNVTVDVEDSVIEKVYFDEIMEMLYKTEKSENIDCFCKKIGIGYESQSLRKIAKSNNISHEQVRQIVKKITERLQNNSRLTVK